MAEAEEEGGEDGGGCSVSEMCEVFAELLEVVCGRDVWTSFCEGDCWVLLLSCKVLVALLIDAEVLCFPVFVGGVLACSSFKGWFVCSVLEFSSSEMTGTWQRVDNTSSLQIDNIL